MTSQPKRDWDLIVGVGTIRRPTFFVGFRTFLEQQNRFWDKWFEKLHTQNHSFERNANEVLHRCAAVGVSVQCTSNYGSFCRTGRFPNLSWRKYNLSTKWSSANQSSWPPPSPLALPQQSAVTSFTRMYRGGSHIYCKVGVFSTKHEPRVVQRKQYDVASAFHRFR